MSKRLRGFTLVEALVIMTVVAVLLAATTRLVTRKALNAPEKNQHGRYEAYYEPDGNAYQIYFDGGGEIIRGPEKCKNDEATKLLNDGRAVCKFEPPPGSENFIITATGGGGAGGTAGGSGNSIDGDNSVTTINNGYIRCDKYTTKKTHDANCGKYRTKPNKDTPFDTYLDLREYNKDNLDVATSGPNGRVRDGSNDPNKPENYFKVSVLTNHSSEFYHTNKNKRFPDPTMWIQDLGSSITPPSKPVAIPNWFHWAAITDGRVGRNESGNCSNGDNNINNLTPPTRCVANAIDNVSKYKIGIFDVAATACSSGGGDAGDFMWTGKGNDPKGDYLALRQTYTKYSDYNYTEHISSSNDCGWVDTTYKTGADGKTKVVDVAGHNTQKNCWTEIYCGSGQYYGCKGSPFKKPASCGSCPAISMAEKLAMVPRDGSTWATGKIEGQKATGRGAPVGNRGSIIDPAKWGCGMVTSAMIGGIFQNMTASAELSNNQIVSYGNHKMALNPGKLPKPGPLKFDNKGWDDTEVYGCEPRGKHGATGVAKINSTTSTATGGAGGRGFCPESENVSRSCSNDPLEDPEQMPSRCKYNFDGPKCNGSSCGGSAPGGQVIAHTPQFPFNGKVKFPDPAADGKLSGSACQTINGYNYCRTGIYNYEFSYEMARGFKRLAYGEPGSPGASLQKNQPQINKPVDIILGKGGEWDPDGKHKNKWNKDSTSRGENGGDTEIVGIAKLPGGPGGDGGRKSDQYELCSIFDKESCKFNGPKNLNKQLGISEYTRIQPGAKGDETDAFRKETYAKGDETDASKKKSDKVIYKDSKITNKTPGKGGNGMGTVSVGEYICNVRAIYNLMATTNKTYNDAFKYNGYKIVLAFKQEYKAGYPGGYDPKLCASATGVGNQYFYEPDENKAEKDKDGNSVKYRMGKDVKENIKKELKGDDAAVVITW